MHRRDGWVSGCVEELMVMLTVYNDDDLRYSPRHPCIFMLRPAAVLEEALFEEFGLRPVRGFEIEHTHKLGNPLLAYTNYPPKHFSRALWEGGK